MLNKKFLFKVHNYLMEGDWSEDIFGLDYA